MGAELLGWALAGCALGCFTGAAPGIHVNTVAMLVVTLAATGNMGFVALIVAMSVVHSFVDFVPSIALGAPDSDSFLGVLPGHRMLMQGEGMRAIRLTIVGGVLGGLVSLAMLPLFLLFVQRFGELLYAFMAPVIGVVIILMVAWERGLRRKFWAAVCVVLSGILGVVVLSNSGTQQGLFPLVTGFFGASTLLCSINSRSIFRLQNFHEGSYGIGVVGVGACASAVAGSLVSLLPGVGPSEAATIVRQAIGKMSRECYMVVLGGINTCNAIYAFVVLWLLGKARSGAAAAVNELVRLDFNGILVVIACVLIAIGIGAFAAEAFGLFALKRLQLVDYAKVNIAVLLLLSAMVLYFGGIWGGIAFGSAAAVGIFAQLSGIRKSICMAFLMVPAMMFYAGFA